MTTPLHAKGRNICQPDLKRPSEVLNDDQAFASSVPGQLRNVKDVFLSIIYTLRPEQKEKEETISSFVDRGVDLLMSILILLEAIDMPHIPTLNLRQVLEDIRTQTEDHLNSYPCFVDALKTVSSIKNRILDHQMVSMLDNLQTSFSSIILQAKDEPLQQIHNNTSSNFFSGANKFTMNNSQFIHVSGDLVTKQPKDRKNNEHLQISGLAPYKDIELEKEIYNGGEYRLHRGLARGKAVIVKVFQGLRAKTLCVRAAEFNRSMMHSNTLHMIGGPDRNSGSSFLVFAGDFEGTVESQLGMALKKGTKEGCIVGFNTIIACSLGLDYLQSNGIPFSSVRSSDFVLLVSRQGKIALSFDAEVTREAINNDIDFGGQLGVVQEDKTIEIFNELIRTTFYTACKNYYREQRLYTDETDDGDELDELEDETEHQFSEPDPDTQGHKSATQKSPRKLKGHRRELIWKFQSANFGSLGEIGRKYQDSLANFHSEDILVHRQGHSTSQIVHRCVGYKRTEIVLTPDIERSGIVSHTSPVPNEICSVCGQHVGTTEIFDCMCGVSNNDLTDTPTIKCTVCSRWQHQSCMEISIDVQMKTYICWRCPGSNITATVVSPSITTNSPVVQTSDMALDTPLAVDEAPQSVQDDLKPIENHAVVPPQNDGPNLLTMGEEQQSEVDVLSVNIPSPSPSTMASDLDSGKEQQPEVDGPSLNVSSPSSMSSNLNFAHMMGDGQQSGVDGPSLNVFSPSSTPSALSQTRTRSNPQQRNIVQFADIPETSRDSPIHVRHPYNLPISAELSSPRTTRLQMVATELPESLLRNLLWERQVNGGNLPATRRSASGGGSRHSVLGGLQPLAVLTPMVQLHPRGTAPPENSPNVRQQAPDPAAIHAEKRRRDMARNKSWANEYHTAGW